MRPFLALLMSTVLVLLSMSCAKGPADEPVVLAEPDMAGGLLLAMAVLDKDEAGRPVPLPARYGVLLRRAGAWTYEAVEDSDSNVFHKVMAYQPAAAEAGILTAGGTAAVLKLRVAGAEPEVLWEADFGGKFSRMRDVEVGDLYGDGSQALAVATHDQGVVAVVRPDGAGGWLAEELDRQENTIVHEVEIGDLDGDGVLEIYATPSLPNKLDGSPQPGQVVRYVPAAGEGRTVVADLGDRHAKEILVDDVDGDGTDELYVSVEAVAGGQVKILRYDADTDPAGGFLVASLDDKLCRFLTAGDIDGDGSKEMVAASYKSGLWLLRPGDDPRAEWTMTSIDRNSSGFEHAAILTDLDADGRDELYVANDKGAEVNQYLWQDGGWNKTTIHAYTDGLSGFTWNIMPAPVELLK
jgi:hypothetical protein